MNLHTSIYFLAVRFLMFLCVLYGKYTDYLSNRDRKREKERKKNFYNPLKGQDPSGTMWYINSERKIEMFEKPKK